MGIDSGRQHVQANLVFHIVLSYCYAQWHKETHTLRHARWTTPFLPPLPYYILTTSNHKTRLDHASTHNYDSWTKRQLQTYWRKKKERKEEDKNVDVWQHRLVDEFKAARHLTTQAYWRVEWFFDLHSSRRVESRSTCTTDTVESWKVVRRVKQ